MYRLLILLIATAGLTASAPTHAQCDKKLSKVTRYVQRSVPELKFLANYLERVSHDETHLMMKLDGCPNPKSEDTIKRLYYNLYVGEDHPDHTARIYTFLVRKDFSACLLWDIAMDTPPIPIAKARKIKEWKQEWADRRNDLRYTSPRRRWQ